jgi:hypothetical protein
MAHHRRYPRIVTPAPQPLYLGGDDDSRDYWDDDDYDEWDDRDEYDDALDDCGQIPHLGGGCLNAGTEYCDFECPFRDNRMYRIRGGNSTQS